MVDILNRNPSQCHWRASKTSLASSIDDPLASDDMASIVGIHMAKAKTLGYSGEIPDHATALMFAGFITEIARVY